MTTAKRMSEFNWMTIDSAPRDGSVFLAGCEGTGNVYDCKFEKKKTGDSLVDSFDFWALRPDGTIETSLMPTHWRPKTTTHNQEYGQ